MPSHNYFSDIWALASIRLRLLLRQKLGWISILVGCLLVLLSLSISNVSFVNPQKIFWDFSLGIIFIFQVGLAVFLGSQLYHEERGRRTLHLILSAGVSRFQWICGNALGIWLGLTLMSALWYLLTLGTSAIVFETDLAYMAFQAVLLMSLETLIIILMSMFLSFILRQMLGLAFSAILVVLLHSMGSIQRIFTDPQVGRFVDDNGVTAVMWAARLLPPLEWLDLKIFVGYESSVGWGFMSQMIALALCWSALLLSFSWLRFEKMDL